MTAEIQSRETVYAGYITVERVKVRLRTGETIEREMEGHGDAVAVLPYDAERHRALVVRLPRVTALAKSGVAELEEACAGMIDDGNPEATCRREAMEELGLRLGALQAVAKVWPSPGVSTEQVTLYLAPYRLEDRVGSGGGAHGEHEEITVVERPLSALACEADAGGIVDGKLLTLVLALRLRRPDLFDAA